MPSISKLVSAESVAIRARVALVAVTLLGVALATAGISRAVDAKASPVEHVVNIENMKFSPATLRVRVGERVEFRNNGLVPHTATAKAAGAFDSGLVKPGQSWTLIAKAAGNFDYTCTFHPMMAGQIRVEERR
jgi:plastocyanin